MNAQENERFVVSYTHAARDDLLRLFEYLLKGADRLEELDAAQAAIDAITEALDRQLGRNPFGFRKAAESPFLRELLIPFSSSGYVALYEIEGGKRVNILALRHQREDDYH